MSNSIPTYKDILGTLYPKSNVVVDNIPIIATVCKKITITVVSDIQINNETLHREYTADIDDPVILRHQSFCDEFRSTSVTIENPSLSLYDLDEEILKEAIFSPIRYLSQGKDNR